jgi:hypothetical protein
LHECAELFLLVADPNLFEGGGQQEKNWLSKAKPGFLF